ncbi:transcriptional regulator with XRE-family HTH domain [Streptomyces sp. V3I8]|uniref:helix-turn-helix transcriptional regulator n=1 Tax=Streptomyces sp. V3I8 TaxID=3042279 RepID=UPI00277DC69E|nr:helix-turn-helix transcriptional regulator [Streptomyces sp. V3I8]MDQ1041352.1 transcriptional regulator with XRE-family HTH domain [Streptomyces sp. V3I8]
MDSGNVLGEFLRARRETTSPDRAEQPWSGRRRTPGLRREEVAQSSGVSTDYYARLEQGREKHPSAQVVHALARALGLNSEESAHLHRLARTDRGPGPGPGPVRRGGGAVVAPSLLRLMDGWLHTPALILDRRLDVLAGNRLGRALFAAMLDQDEVNLVRFTFLNPAARDFYPDWERVARSGLAALRAGSGGLMNDPRLTELVGELSLKSAEFRDLWARHDVRGKAHEAKTFSHDQVGELTLAYDSFTVDSAPDQQLIVYQAEPGSPSQQALALLGTVAADLPAPQTAPLRDYAQEG